MSGPTERVAALEAAYYRCNHDRERIAAVLKRAAELVTAESREPAPLQLMQLRWAEQHRLARQLRQFAREVLCAERPDI